MSKKPVTKAIWMTMVKRYTVASVIGLIACVYFFYRLYIIGPGQVIPPWLIIGASVGGLMLSGGLFGIAVSFFMRMWHK